MKKINVNNSSHINQIVEKIHDQWFDINEIKYTNNALSLKIRKERIDKSEIIRNFFFWKKIMVPVEDWYLRIFNVENYNIEDKEKIGLYDFNSMEYIENEKRLKVITGIPLKFEIFVSGIEITLEETSNVSDRKIKTRIG